MLTELIRKKRFYFDGGTGTLLQAAGLLPGEAPERWSITHPDVITSLHAAYLDAGSDIITVINLPITASLFPLQSVAQKRR